MAESALAWLVILSTVGFGIFGTIFRKLWRRCATKDDIESAIAPLRADVRANTLRNIRIELQLRRLNETIADMTPSDWVPPDGP